MLSKTNGGFLISRVKQVSGRVFEKILAQSNIGAFNGAQGRILHVLWQTDRVPIIQLSKKTGLAKTTLTSMLDRMEKSGLIQRVCDKSDRRQILIALTEKAESLKGEYDRVSAEMNEIFYQGFSDGEAAQFENYLNRILSNLTEGKNEKSIYSDN